MPVELGIVWYTPEYDLLDGAEVESLSADYFRDGGAWMKAAYNTVREAVRAARAQYLGRGQDGTAIMLEVCDGKKTYHVSLDDGPPWRRWMIVDPADEPAGPLAVDREGAIIQFVRNITNRRISSAEALQAWDLWRRRGFETRFVTVSPESPGEPGSDCIAGNISDHPH